MLGVALLLTMSAGCMPIGGDFGASTAASLNLVPDPGYRPQAGDRASLYGVDNGTPLEQVPVLADVTAYDKYERFIQADDPVELSNMEQQSWLQYVPSGTPVYLVKIVDRNHTGAQVGAEVKILDGSQKGRIVWTRLANIARLKRPDPVE
jgi:hypothetical protein